MFLHPSSQSKEKYLLLSILSSFLLLSLFSDLSLSTSTISHKAPTPKIRSLKLTTRSSRLLIPPIRKAPVRTVHQANHQTISPVENHNLQERIALAAILMFLEDHHLTMEKMTKTKMTAKKTRT